MTTLNSNTMVSMINTSSSSGIITLPQTSDIPFRAIIFKDYTGYTNQNSTFTISTQSNDLFENGTNTMIFSNSYDYVALYANPNNNQWTVLFTSVVVTDGEPTNWSSYPALGTVDINYNNIYNISNITIYDNYVKGNTSYIFGSNGFIFYGNNYNTNAIASDWYNFQANNTVYMNNNDIENVLQTTNPTSAATNGIIPQSYTNSIDSTNFTIGYYSEILTNFPSYLSFQSINGIYTNLAEVTFTFSGELLNVDTNFAFYFSLRNNTQDYELQGNNFNSNIPYCLTSNFINPYNISASYTDTYDLSSWNNGDQWWVYFYIQGSNCFLNNFNSGIYSVFIQPSIQYGI